MSPGFTETSQDDYGWLTGFGPRKPKIQPMNLPSLKSTVTWLRADCRPIDTCLVCHDAVRPDDMCVPVLGGGLVHQGCATYKMRQRVRVRRVLRAG